MYDVQDLDHIPDTMRAVLVTRQVQRYDESCKDCFEVVQKPLPIQIPPSHSLVRVLQAQINPADASYFKVWARFMILMQRVNQAFDTHHEGTQGMREK